MANYKHRRTTRNKYLLTWMDITKLGFPGSVLIESQDESMHAKLITSRNSVRDIDRITKKFYGHNIACYLYFENSCYLHL